MRFLFFVFSFLAAVQSTSAGEAPSVGILYNTSDRASLTFDCRSSGHEKLSCEFVQTSVRRKLNPVELAGKLELARVEFSEKKAGFSEEECQHATTLLGILEGKHKPPVGADFSQLSETDRSYAVSLSKAITRFCSDKTLENYIKVSRVEYEKQTKTCLIASNSFKQVFSKAASGAWIVEAQRTGDCGVVRLDKFEADESNGIKFWNYTSRKAVTNPKATFGLFGLSCSGLDEREYLYSWRKKDPEFSCESVEFSPI